MNFSKAMTTADGCIVDLAQESDATTHPKYGMPAYRAVIEVPLLPAQQELCEALLARSGLREIHRSTRSSIDQLGLFGCTSGSTKIQVHDGVARIHTLITLVDLHPRNKVLAALRAVVDTNKAQYCRLLLTPDESKHGERSLPIEIDREIWYDHDALTQAQLENLWLGAPGRETILPAKRERSMRRKMKPGQFLIGEMEAMDPEHPSKEHLWVLKRRVRCTHWKNRTNIRHGEACGFDPHRSTGVRQGEFFHIGKKALSTRDLFMVADQFELDYDNSHGAQHSGV